MSRACPAFLVLAAILATTSPVAVEAMCNAIPTAARSFASTRGEVDRPFVSPGRAVRLRVDRCDGTAFVPDDTTVEVLFAPPEGPETTIAVPPANVVSVTSSELVFVFPETEALGTLRTGPATIIARVGATEVARIDVLGSRDEACVLARNPVFSSFTALPPPNRFHCLAAGACVGTDDPTRIRATIDDAGNLLVPWDWGGVFPPGRGFDPVARLVRAGQTSLEAFSPPDPRAGRGIIIPSVAYVSAHALTGNVLPPLLDVGPPRGTGPFPGSTITGTVDSLDGVLRIARRLGDDAATEIFDMHDRLEGGVGAIVISHPTASEEPLVDLRSLTASTHVTAMEQPTRGPGTSGLLVYDNRSGALGRLPALATGAPLPRRIAVSDAVAAYYDATTDATTPSLTVFEVGRLGPSPVLQAVPSTSLVPTNLFGSDGTGGAPAVGGSVVGGYLGPDRVPTVFDVATGAMRPGRVLGGNLIETEEGIVNGAFPERFAAFDGELAPLGPGRPGHALAADDRAIFLVCDGPCQDDDGASRDRILMLLDRDGSLRELARNVGTPFLFTGAVVGLVAHEDASYGGVRSEDLDGDGMPTGAYLRLYDLTRDRPVLPQMADGRPLAIAGALPELAASAHVLTVVVDEASAGSLNCDADAADHVVTLVNALTGRVFNTREPAASPARLGHGRGLTIFAQTENVLGDPLGTDFLNVVRDSDGDEIPDPYDVCPLRANPTQADRDGNGAGDACDAACPSGACDGARAVAAADVLACADRVGDALGALFTAALRAETTARTTARPPALARARRMLRRCTPDIFTALGACADSIDSLVGTPEAPGCLLAAASATAAEVLDGATRDAESACALSIRKAAAANALRRFRRLARCPDAVATDPVDETVDALAACAASNGNAGPFARLGRAVRRSIAAACDAPDLLALVACDGAARPTLDTLADARGTGGCIVTRTRLAVDAMLRDARHGASLPGSPDGAACPARPEPSPTATPRPHTITIRVEDRATTRPLPALVLGWNGVDNAQPAFGGTALVADLACAAGDTSCAVHAALAGQPFGAPVPLALQVVATCVTFEGRGDADGTFDTASGELSLTLPLRMRTFSSASIDQPCPFCLTADGRPDVGEYGTCAGGPNAGAACRVEGVSVDFGATGGTSTTCLPPPEILLDDRAVTLHATTATTVLAPTAESPRCRAVGFTTEQCPCDTCNGLGAEPCATNADCPPSGGAPGVCGGRRCYGGPRAGLPCAMIGDCPGSVCTRTGEVTRLNPCTDGVCTPVPEGDGVCLGDPLASRCAEAPWRACSVNLDCPFGFCVADRPRRCFPDTIVRPGSADPPSGGHAEPTLAGAFCAAPTAAHSVNTVLGLPGPAAFTLPVRIDYLR